MDYRRRTKRELIEELENLRRRRSVDTSAETDQGARRLEKHTFETLAEHAPFGMIMITENGTARYVNPNFHELFGYDVHDFPYGREWLERARAYSLCQREGYAAFGARELHPAVCSVIGKDGREKSIHFRPVRLDSGEYLITCEDVTERKRAEEALRRSEEQYRSLYEKSVRAEEIYWSLLNSCADPIVIYDMQGNVKYVSDSWTRTFGWTLQELEGRRIPYVPESEREITQACIDDVVNLGIANSGFETKRLTKDGRVLEVSISASRYHDHEGKPAGMLGIVCDVTQRKKASEALAQSEKQLRLLSAQLLTAQENERKRVAQELHDGIGQSLTAIKFRLENCLKQMSPVIAPEHAQSVEAIIPLIQDAIEEVRRISMDLRPSTLDDLGILATITWFCRNFQATFGRVRIEKQIGLTEEEIPAALKIVVFRILQEAMNNVAKHSNADTVRVSLGTNSGALELVVADNGAGFDWNAALAADRGRKGFGLASMRERTEFSGGTFAVEAMNGTTVIRAFWPLEKLRAMEPSRIHYSN